MQYFLVRQQFLKAVYVQCFTLNKSGEFFFTGQFNKGYCVFYV